MTDYPTVVVIHFAFNRTIWNWNSDPACIFTRQQPFNSTIVELGLVDIFGPVFAAFIAVDEAGVGFGLNDEDGVGGDDDVVNLWGVSPVVEEQVVDDLVFAAGQAAKDGGDMFLSTAAFWDQSAAEKQQ